MSDASRPELEEHHPPAAAVTVAEKDHVGMDDGTILRRIDPDVITGQRLSWLGRERRGAGWRRIGW